MLRASALDLAAVRDEAPATDTTIGVAPARPDRRLSASNQAWLGKVVDARYRVLEVIGRGGMGVVYKVEHVRMGKIAAMKVLHRDLADDPEVVHRFEREAAAVSKLHHPNTVQVFDFGTANGALYLVMEYVRGQDLGHVVDRDGPLPFARAAPLLTQILGALTEAHELGIVHRDLKPENVLITRTTGGRDFAKVLDFGLAKVIEPGRAPDVSDRSQIVGTPYFMAPEQIRGDDVDARTDLYAMGALTYRLLTGTYPYDAKSAVGVLTKHLTAELEPPSRRAPSLDIAPEIDEIAVTALAKDPNRRWANAAAMAGAIEATYAELVGDRLLGSSRAGSSSQRRRWMTEDDEPLSELRLRRSDLDAYERSLKRQRAVVTASGALVVLGIGGAALWWTLLREPPTRREEVEPNDTAARATRIAPATKVTGYLGKRRSTTAGDVDLYTVDLPGEAPIATVRLSGLPNLDITLAVRDRAGRLIAAADEEGVAGGEVVHRRRAAGTLVIEVGQVMAGDLPVENVSDAYTLEVVAEPADPGWEVEPNGEPSDATPIGPGQVVRGYLDARDDVDVLRWDGPDGQVTVDIQSPAAATIEWRGGDGGESRWQPAGPPAPLAVRRGDVIRLRRLDRERGKGPLPGSEAVWVVTITPSGA
ncbi:MAG TPA: serine/threonine-protein kinase [Kofleriaceae bacterium]|nr:serine/threonine-protein kinase [Kofleriaceae bacterium]